MLRYVFWPCVHVDIANRMDRPTMASRRAVQMLDHRAGSCTAGSYAILGGSFFRNKLMSQSLLPHSETRIRRNSPMRKPVRGQSPLIMESTSAMPTRMTSYFFVTIIPPAKWCCFKCLPLTFPAHLSVAAVEQPDLPAGFVYQTFGHSGTDGTRSTDQ